MSMRKLARGSHLKCQILGFENENSTEILSQQELALAHGYFQITIMSYWVGGLE